MDHNDRVALGNHTRERSIVQLLSEVTSDMSTLVGKEIELAKVELSRELSRTAQDAATIGIGGALLHIAGLALVATVVLVLVKFGVAAWVASLITGLVIAAIGYAMVQRGRAA